jgi:hypothetical protein
MCLLKVISKYSIKMELLETTNHIWETYYSSENIQ